MRKLLLALALCLAPSLAFAQCTGVFPNNTVCGNGSGASALPRATAVPLGGLSLALNNIYVGNASGNPTGVAMGGDCTIVAAGTVTCLKTNNVPFTTAATTLLGTSGATIPLLSTANAWTLSQTFSVATGTPPFFVASTTNVANLNASSLNGATFAAPGPIGGGTPSTGNFTAATIDPLTGTNSANLNLTGRNAGVAAPVLISGNSAGDLLMQPVPGRSFIVDPGSGTASSIIEMVGRNAGTGKITFITTDPSGNINISPVIGQNVSIDPGGGTANGLLGLYGRNAGVGKQTFIYADPAGNMILQPLAGSEVTVTNAGDLFLGNLFNVSGKVSIGATGAAAPTNGLYVQGDTVTNGLLRSTYGTPTITSGNCGTGANGTVTGSNQSGLVSIGAAATATCTINFSTTLAVAPNACVIAPANAAAAAWATTVARVSSISTTTWVITGTALANANFYYTCL